MQNTKLFNNFNRGKSLAAAGHVNNVDLINNISSNLQNVF